MARLLNKLAEQPTPLLKRLNLDAQPERPLLQRLLTRLPQRRAGERYAFGASPLAFLAGQPQRPLLSGINFRQEPRVSPATWVSKPPLNGLANAGQPLLGQMDSNRMPGVVTALLLLGLCLNYLLSVGTGIEKTPAAPPVAESTEALEPEVIEVADPETATPLTPEEEKEVALAESVPEDNSKIDSEAAMAAATSANLMADSAPADAEPEATSKETAAEETVLAQVRKDDNEKTTAPDVETSAAPATVTPSEDGTETTEPDAATVATQSESSVPAPEETVPAQVMAEAAAEEMGADKPAETSSPQVIAEENTPETPAPEATPEATTTVEPAATVAASEEGAAAEESMVSEAEVPDDAATTEAVASQEKSEEESLSAGLAPMAEQETSSETLTEESPAAPSEPQTEAVVAEAKTDQPAVDNPRRLSAERSQGILDSARVIYLLGDGPLALERLGLALSAGHVHQDYVERFKKLEADIGNLLSLYNLATAADSPKAKSMSRAAFLDAEQAVFSDQTSAYATRLEMSAAAELQAN